MQRRQLALVSPPLTRLLLQGQQPPLCLCYSRLSIEIGYNGVNEARGYPERLGLRRIDDILCV